MIVRVIMIRITLDNEELTDCYWPILDCWLTIHKLNSYKCGEREETISASPSTHTNPRPAMPANMSTSDYQTFLISPLSSEVGGEQVSGQHRFSIREHRTWPHHLHFQSLQPGKLFDNVRLRLLASQ